MEGVGFLSSCASDNPRWVVVKGISDFADGSPGARSGDFRERACYNSAKFVLAALNDGGNTDA